MPRPRVVRVGKGEVTIKNLSRSEGDDIERFLTTPMDDRREVVFNEDKEEYELIRNLDPFKDSDLSQVALGFISDESGFHSVEVSFDPNTEMGKVTKKTLLHKNINHARNLFNIIFSKRFL